MSNEYNGWKNYETWCVFCHLTNDEGTQRQAEEMAAEAKEQAEDDETVRRGSWTKEQAARYLLAQALKAMVEERNPLAGDCSFFADLLQSAIDEIDWHELAESFLAE